MFGLTSDQLWMSVGFLGEGLFGLRFIVQWIASERKKESVVPVAFWYLSLLGASLVLAYAIYLENLVFILGSGVPLLIYVRNLWLVYHKPETPVAAG